MEGLWELTNALLNGTIPDPLRPPLPQDWRSATYPKTNRYYLRKGYSCELQIWQIQS